LTGTHTHAHGKAGLEPASHRNTRPRSTTAPTRRGSPARTLKAPCTGAACRSTQAGSQGSVARTRRVQAPARRTRTVGRAQRTSAVARRVAARSDASPRTPRRPPRALPSPIRTARRRARRHSREAACSALSNWSANLEDGGYNTHTTSLDVGFMYLYNDDLLGHPRSPGERGGWAKVTAANQLPRSPPNRLLGSLENPSMCMSLLTARSASSVTLRRWQR
jgi:hypothetical protein